MFNFNSKKKQEIHSIEDFLIILNKIQELNNEPTPKRNNWRLRQTWINNYIDLTRQEITKK